MKRENQINVRKLTYLAILTALIVVLQMLAPMINFFGLAPALVLVPMVVGVAVCGIGAGAWLGLVFGFIVLMVDPTVAAFYAHNAIATIVLVLLKAVLAGVVSGIVFKALRKKNKKLAIILAAITAPFVNTLTFILGCIIFFLDLTGFVIFGLLISGNFIAELVINIVLVPAIYRIIELSERKR